MSKEKNLSFRFPVATMQQLQARLRREDTTSGAISNFESRVGEWRTKCQSWLSKYNFKHNCYSSCSPFLLHFKTLMKTKGGEVCIGG